MQKKDKFFLSWVINKLKLTKGEFIAFFLIICTSLFLRFVNYGNRWGLAYDQARDVIVSHQILVNMELPLTGPFSASGQFVFGPFWYWFHAFITFLNPHEVMWLWIVQTTISSLMPIVMFFIGRIIVNSKFGLLLAFFTAISTAQIAQSTNLTYSTFVGFVAIFILFFLVLSVKTERSLFIFFTALLMGLSINIHFQAVGFFSLLPLLFFIGRKSIQKITVIICGFFIPFIPLLIFDFTNNHFQSTHIWDFLFNRTDPGAMQKRWLTYLGDYWPKAYSHIIGGYLYAGIISGVTLSVFYSYLFLRKRVTKIILMVTVFFAINVVVLRYFKGAVYDSFLVYLHPTILLLTAWLVFKLYKYNKILGIILFLIITLFTLIKDGEEIINATNRTAEWSKKVVSMLQKDFPDDKFAVYDYGFRSSGRSAPVVMYLLKNSLLSDNGTKVGFLRATISAELDIHDAPIIYGGLGQTVILDLDEFERKDLELKGWTFVNPSEVYRSVLHWYKE